MQFAGDGVWEGIAIGTIFLSNTQIQVVENEIKEPLAAYEAARLEVKKRLDFLYDKAKGSVGEEDAAIFLAQQMILEDPEYVEAIEKAITEQNKSVKDAICSVTKGYEPFMEKAGRLEDLNDVRNELLAVLESKMQNAQPKEDHILVTTNLTPVELMRLETKHLLGIVLRDGSVHSHTAILARGMGITMLTQTKWEGDLQGKVGIVDAKRGIFLVDPSQEEYNLYQNEHWEKENKSICGAYANVNSVSEAQLAYEKGATGIGLFRSEFLFLAKEEAPSEQEQYQVYRDVVLAMKGKPVVIRTLDLGADKMPAYWNSKERGIRFCFERPKAFMTQLRAIFRAGAHGEVAIMLPMIETAEEVRQAKAFMEQAKACLRRDGIPWGECRVGVMIETKAAVENIKSIAKEAAFFSIGTNDLTAELQGCERENAIEPFPMDTILETVRFIVEEAHQVGILVTVCGDLAMNKKAQDFFESIGVDGISLPPQIWK